MVLRLIKSVLPSRAPDGGQAPAPDAPFYAIGDVHGRDDLLARLIERIEHDARIRGLPPRIVFLGDLVDRGGASAQALHRVRRHILSRPGSVCLMGNHEQMLLEFLDDPAGLGLRWLRHGGVATLASYGIAARRDEADPDTLLDLSDRLADALEDTAGWLRALPLHWASGNVHCVHAGMDPMRPADQQNPDSLIWGHAAFLRRPRSDGAWVVHGHSIVKEPQNRVRRIALDTGAWRTGVLTAGAILPETAPRFLQERS